MQSTAGSDLTLKARCSRKCAVPLVVSVSARLPASIHTPTVEVWAHGECSVAICSHNQLLSAVQHGSMYTVKPLLNVVHSVVAPWLTGVAKVLLSGSTDLVKAARLRRPRARFRAISREAIAAGEMGNGV